MLIRYKSGFTLIEILLTIAFLFTSLLAVLQVFPTAFGLERINQMRSQAVLLAQAKIEAINSQGYQTVAVGEVFESALASPFELFSRRTKITYVDGNLQTSASDVGLKKIEITVAWQSALPLVPKDFKLIGLVAAK